MTDDADLITVKGGTNDWGVSIPLGSSTTRSSNTFKGSLRLLVEGLIDKYPSKPIVLFTPIKRCGDGKTPDTVNGNGDKLIDFANAVIEIGEIYGIPVIDLYTPEVLDFTDLGPYEDYETMMPDHLHPSGAGQKIMGEYMMQKMIDIGVVKDVTNEIGNLDIDFDNIEFYKYTADELLSTAVGTQCQVNSELIDNYMRITTSSTSTDTNTYVTLDLEALGADFPVKQFKYAVVSYRSEMESNQPWNMSVLIKRDGIYSRHWGMNHYPLRDGKQQYDILPIHTLISGGEKAGYTSYDDIDDDSILKQIRLKPWGGGELIPGEGDYLDIEFIAFFDEAYLANAYLLNEINGDSADDPDDNPDDDPENDPTDVPGDVNGDGKVTRPDLIRLTQYFANWDVEINNYSADTNGDGKVTRPDLIRLTQYFENWDVELGK